MFGRWVEVVAGNLRDCIMQLAFDEHSNVAIKIKCHSDEFLWATTLRQESPENHPIDKRKSNRSLFTILSNWVALTEFEQFRIRPMWLTNYEICWICFFFFRSIGLENFHTQNFILFAKSTWNDSTVICWCRKRYGRRHQPLLFTKRQWSPVCAKVEMCADVNQNQQIFSAQTQPTGERS